MRQWFNFGGNWSRHSAPDDNSSQERPAWEGHLSHVYETAITQGERENALINAPFADIASAVDPQQTGYASTGYGPAPFYAGHGNLDYRANLAAMSQYPPQVPQVPQVTTQPFLGQAQANISTSGMPTSFYPQSGMPPIPLQTHIPQQGQVSSSMAMGNYGWNSYDENLYPAYTNPQVTVRSSDQQRSGSYPELQPPYNNNMCQGFAPWNVSNNPTMNETSSLKSGVEPVATMVETAGVIIPLRRPARSLSLNSPRPKRVLQGKLINKYRISRPRIANSSPHNRINPGLLLSSVEVFASDNECAVTDGSSEFEIDNKDQSDESQDRFHEEEAKGHGEHKSGQTSVCHSSLAEFPHFDHIN